MSRSRRWTGKERLINGDSKLSKARVLDFWQYAFSDLKANNVRGILAEGIVAKLLDIPLTRRDSWAEWDLDFQNCKIEVKASAYLQTWRQKRVSKIVFAGLKKCRWYPAKRGYAKTATCNADWYVFCVQTEVNQDKWNALDLYQWRFYIVPKAKLRDRRSISLSVVKTLSKEMTAGDFQHVAKKLIKDNH